MKFKVMRIPTKGVRKVIFRLVPKKFGKKKGGGFSRQPAAGKFFTYKINNLC